jgi:hypothetical protein
MECFLWSGSDYSWGRRTCLEIFLVFFSWRGSDNVLRGKLLRVQLAGIRCRDCANIVLPRVSILQQFLREISLSRRLSWPWGWVDGNTNGRIALLVIGIRSSEVSRFRTCYWILFVQYASLMASKKSKEGWKKDNRLLSQAPFRDGVKQTHAHQALTESMINVLNSMSCIPWGQCPGAGFYISIRT